jgi:hypothetical protein
MLVAISLFGVKLDNPVTPWLVLALVTAGWLAVYLTATGERDS